MSFKIEDQYDKIYRYCYFKVNNSDTAEDLTQETFLKYFTQTSYINKGKPLAYLYTIAKNLCIDYFRKVQSVTLGEEISAPDEIPAVETNLVLREAVSVLPKELQELLLLRFANELEVGEIASMLQISRFAVYRKLKGALKQLKIRLGEGGFTWTEN